MDIPPQIAHVMQQSAEAFALYRRVGVTQRAAFLDAVAAALEAAGAPLLQIAAAETHLSLPRLRSEMARTCFQFRMFAQALREGFHAEAMIDHARPQAQPPAPDLRRMRVPVGPVVVFGASNFPFAYSTAGGDTASALAAGCSVVVKQHPAHAATSQRVYEILRETAEACSMPANIIQHVPDEGFATGKALVQHPAAAAVGFTGSQQGGQAIQQYAAQRPLPIPVFAEMGSVNPVFLLPGALADDAAGIARQLAASITTGMGQFCTNPGIMLALPGPHLDAFTAHLGNALREADVYPMLHAGIATAYMAKTSEALLQKGVTLLWQGGEGVGPQPCIATISGENFLAHPQVQEEIFGPWSLLVRCRSGAEMADCRKALAGQLTTSFMANAKDIADYAGLVELAVQHAGRVVFNGVPTGVTVSPAMVHGGPQPSCSDSRFTAVGVAAMYRWTRPVCWQNAPAHLLPPELQDDNPLQLWRFVNGEWKR